MALVITLILLSVITFMAVTFLVISRRERASVATMTDQTVARLATDAGRDRAVAELLVPILVSTNFANFDLLVSTNYFNAIGFINGISHPTNVNYSYLSGGGVLNDNQFRQNIANLLYSPRVPVFVQTNPSTAFPRDFRFYLDLNRNGRFDTNGWLPVVGPGGELYDTNGIRTLNPPYMSNYYVGDPEWIGILERPDQPHSSSNRFLARYAVIVVPAGKTLDVNYSHNQTLNFPLGLNNDGYVRNQGAGTYEINLAAFLADLNTNQWNAASSPYLYLRGNIQGTPAVFGGSPNTGLAFADAFSLLRHRYAGNYGSLLRLRDIFGNNAVQLANNGIDEFSDGSPFLTGPILDNENITRNWLGSENPNHFFTTQDYFDRGKTQVGNPGFTDRLLEAGRGVSSYDRYTFYRMLAQLGTDTGPETGKINVNYDNTITNAQGGVIGLLSAPPTNLPAWTPLKFFTNAADLLLRNYSTNWFLTDPANYMVTFFNARTNGLTNFTDPNYVMRAMNIRNSEGELAVPGLSVTNIPVWVNNRFVYTPSAHRLLQLAANIYDSTTNAMPFAINPQGHPFLPHVFRPIFAVTNEAVHRVSGVGQVTFTTNVYIVGYTNVTQPDEVFRTVSTHPIRDLLEPSDLALLQPNDNVYGVPIVVGAKKGLPNFNEYSSQTAVTVSRRMEFRRNNINGDPNDPANPVTYTNQLYTVGISNLFAVEAWNSYSTNFPRALRMAVSNDVSIVFFTSNGLNRVVLQSNRLAMLSGLSIPARTWTGLTNIGGNTVIPAASFVIPSQTNITFSPTNIGFLQSATGFEGVPNNASFRRVGNRFPVEPWWMQVRSRVRYMLLDDSAGSQGAQYILDYVSFSLDEDLVDVTYLLMRRDDGSAPSTLDGSAAGAWNTNRVGALNDSAPTRGMVSQIAVGLGTTEADWNNYTMDSAAGNDRDKAIRFFKFNLAEGELTDTNNLYKTNIFYAPFVPHRTIYQHTSLQANDPLVHYTVSDLTFVQPVDGVHIIDHTPANPPLKNLGAANLRYQPWGRKTTISEAAAPHNLAVKDPLVSKSDDWNFPTNKLANIGWVGGVHRGTPWQTVYMKSTDLAVATNLSDVVVGGQASPVSWTRWSGNSSFSDALRTRPAEDRMLFDLFSTTIHENTTKGQLPVNQSGLAAWSAVLSGVIALTNSANETPLPGEPVLLTPHIIQPAGVDTNSPVARIVRAINNVRATNVFLFPSNTLVLSNTFLHAGDVLAVPELTVASPYLNRDGVNYPDINLYGISEEAYERIPRQIMGLLRKGEPRFVIYAFGQALKPAPNSIITRGDFFGMCTNYQVMAEVATRTVVRVEDPPRFGMTNAIPRIATESFNILGADE